MVRLALLKHKPEKWDLQGNMAAFRVFAKKAQARGANLFVTCESFLDGYCVTDKDLDFRRFLTIAQDISTSEHIDCVRQTAKDAAMHVVFGFSQRVEGGVKNAAVLVDSNGCIKGIYHKTHLLDHDLHYLPGEDLPVFDTDLGRLGIMICADRRWPETARTLKLKGADFLVNPTYGMHHYANEWWMRTRAYENEMHVAFVHPMGSLVCNPVGDLEAKLVSNVSDILVHDIYPKNRPSTMLTARRPELYTL